MISDRGTTETGADPRPVFFFNGVDWKTHQHRTQDWGHTTYLSGYGALGRHAKVVDDFNDASRELLREACR